MASYLALSALLLTSAAASPDAMRSRSATRDMVVIPAGSYRPLYTSAGRDRVRIAAFRLDRDHVTRNAFERFILAHPSWQRAAVSRAMADEGYLADLDVAPNATSAARGDAPVTRVSWFAARAYCESQGKRLPTVDEWEYVAAADETRRDASADPVVRTRILALTAARRPTMPAGAGGPANVYGVRGLHGVVWEWTQEYNGVVAHEAHGKPSPQHHHDLNCAGGAIGASDPSNYPAFARFSVRGGLTQRSTAQSVGFRCAANL